jgi:DNA-binding PadR family transcriptional regulator
MMRRGRVYCSSSKSQWYAEPKRLERLGLLRSRKETGRTRPRTHYELTDRGPRRCANGRSRRPASRAFRTRRSSASSPPTSSATRPLEGPRGLRSDLDEVEAAIDAAEAEAGRLPHRERYLRLNHRLARRVLDAHREWLAEVERALGGDG